MSEIIDNLVRMYFIKLLNKVLVLNIINKMYWNVYYINKIFWKWKVSVFRKYKYYLILIYVCI